MTDLPDDQRLLLDGLLARLEGVADQPALVRFMAEVLGSLLRRQGDAEFRATIHAAFTDGLLAHTWEEQKTLAAEVIRVVIVKRPEIALAWQAAHAAPPPPQQRRATDQPAVSAAPAASPPSPPPDPYAEAEAGLGAYVAELLVRRVALMRVPPPRMPSAAYRHGRPFFLFDPSFPQVLGAFVAGPLLRLCREGMERRVYRLCEGNVPADAEAWKTFMADKRDAVWAILLDRLERLAVAHDSAEAKLAAQAQAQGEAGPGYRIVEMPISRPRVYSILGVEFTLGQVVTTRRVRVRVPPANQLEPHERQALDLLADLARLADRAGIDLPDAVDYQFLRTLFDFNARQFTQVRDEMMALLAHSGTSIAFLKDRMAAIDATLSHNLADILGMMLFATHGDGRFDLGEFTSFCLGAARDMSAVVNTRPFCAQEVSVRPRELALQLRDAVRQRVHPDIVQAAVERLLDCWTAIGRQRFGRELDQGLAVIDAFETLFADDPDLAAIAEIGRLVRGGLTAAGATTRQSLLLAIGRVYEPIGRRAPGYRH